MRTTAQGLDQVGVTYGGPAGQGSIVITLTADRTGVISVQLKDVLTHLNVTPDPQQHLWTLQSFYHPPVPIIAGGFQAFAEDRLGGTYQSDIDIQGVLRDNTLSGTATTKTCSANQKCYQFVPVTWTATEQPQEVGATLIKADFVDHDGHLTIDLGDDGTAVRAVTLVDVPLTPCSSTNEAFSAKMVFDPPADPASFSKDILGGTTDIIDFYLVGSVTPDGKASGTLRFGVPYRHCESTYTWQSVPHTPTAQPITLTPALTPRPGLPSAGGHPDEAEPTPILPLAVAGVLLTAAGLAAWRRIVTARTILR